MTNSHGSSQNIKSKSMIDDQPASVIKHTYHNDHLKTGHQFRHYCCCFSRSSNQIRAFQWLNAAAGVRWRHSCAFPLLLLHLLLLLLPGRQVSTSGLVLVRQSKQTAPGGASSSSCSHFTQVAASWTRVILE